MIQYVIFALLLLIWMKTETFNQNYVHGQTLSNENKPISDEDVKKNPSKTQEYSPKRSFYYIFATNKHFRNISNRIIFSCYTLKRQS